MTTYKSCSVDGCGNNSHYTARGRGGYCSAHHSRLKRHGDPLAGRTAPGEAHRYLREVVFLYQGDDCLIWPYARNSAGYGHTWVDGTDQLVHRLVCIDTNGTPPHEQYYAAHRCGNGHLGCCTPRHVRWATPKENSGDTALHGTRVNGERQHCAKLTESDVRDIRASSEPAKSIAARYGVAPSNISYVRRRATWKHVA